MSRGLTNSNIKSFETNAIGEITSKNLSYDSNFILCNGEDISFESYSELFKIFGNINLDNQPIQVSESDYLYDVRQIVYLPEYKRYIAFVARDGSNTIISSGDGGKTWAIRYEDSGYTSNTSIRRKIFCKIKNEYYAVLTNGNPGGYYGITLVKSIDGASWVVVKRFSQNEINSLFSFSYGLISNARFAYSNGTDGIIYIGGHNFFGKIVNNSLIAIVSSSSHIYFEDIVYDVNTSSYIVAKWNDYDGLLSFSNDTVNDSWRVLYHGTDSNEYSMLSVSIGNQYIVGFDKINEEYGTDVNKIRYVYADIKHMYDSSNYNIIFLSTSQVIIDQYSYIDFAYHYFFISCTNSLTSTQYLWWIDESNIMNAQTTDFDDYMIQNILIDNSYPQIFINGYRSNLTYYLWEIEPIAKLPNYAQQYYIRGKI